MSNIKINESQFNDLVSKCVRRSLKEGQGFNFFKDVKSMNDDETEKAYNEIKNNKDYQSQRMDFIKNGKVKDSTDTCYGKDGRSARKGSKINNGVLGRMGRYAGIKGAEALVNGRHFMNKLRKPNVATESVKKNGRVIFEGTECYDDYTPHSKDSYWEELVEFGIATNEEIELVTSINGYTVETLDDILYTRTGNRSWEQFCQENDIEL